MKMLIASLVLLFAFGLPSVSTAQDANQAANTPTSAPPKPGVEAKAPPPITGAVVVPAECLVVLESKMAAAAGNDTTPGKQFGIVADLRVIMTLTPDKTSWVFHCGLPEKQWDLYDTKSHSNGGNMSQLRVPVWTADDSKAQQTFLMAEIKSMISAAVQDGFVKDKTVQESVAKALETNQTVATAINTALQNNAVFQKAVLDALEEKLPSFRQKIVDDVVKQMKADQSQ
jgi:hypothetical protein